MDVRLCAFWIPFSDDIFHRLDVRSTSTAHRFTIPGHDRDLWRRWDYQSAQTFKRCSSLRLGQLIGPTRRRTSSPT
ncbi:hypothetical protein PGTUg99_021657 [Puccinia graminis f. sp. tritici]|uniref:Uncharacterized protein n=1 Tax=Puccinia graminis f. sp. tritici TaxID=56615 RepID=A0A5B0LWF6_PUCGR|nr:hypothetical protein PGTUg99_021657 [Puccinia graminis f. sp. tritici]